MRTVIMVSIVLFQLGDMIPKSKWKLITVDEDGDADNGNSKEIRSVDFQISSHNVQ